MYTCTHSGEELQAAVNFEILTLDTNGDWKDFAPEEIALEDGVASIRYVTEGEEKQVIILTSGKSDTIDTSSRSALTDALVGETLVSLAEDEAQQQKSGWWTAEDMTYCIDTFNIEYPDFKTLLESFTK